ncbi:Sugar phosphate isomerase/epimerase [Streptomyces sp. TverLS-915]|uniref:sugar phosphate isomerase/epimerase family protein n=1 Tax=Streptomyces sp. TverLS-915 TaxID=1839763 RepID=UPI00081DF8A0|nr:sugar phosphate isomerase/epimerase family protein [Streptomyces sp. TverLS-915]SCD86347.1 Sugar phosphate isomerase/epimerase [Streptomyces sp. TverLS-915]
MKLAFSTLGVPGMPVPEVVRLAATHGYHGVELRAHPEEPLNLTSTAAERAAAREAFAAGGIEVLGVAGYVKVAEPGEDEPHVTEMRALVELAHDLGAGFVRVFPGGSTEQSGAEADATAERRLGLAAEHAAGLGVRILLETHDSHRTGAAATRVLGTVGHKSTGALWDTMHTWLGGEQPEESYLALAPYLGYVQVKDIASREDTTPLPLGAGVLPLGEVVEVLTREGWDGWLCWEYEKRWYADAADLAPLLGPGAEYLRRLLNEAA